MKIGDKIILYKVIVKYEGSKTRCSPFLVEREYIKQENPDSLFDVLVLNKHKDEEHRREFLRFDRTYFGIYLSYMPFGVFEDPEEAWRYFMRNTRGSYFRNKDNYESQERLLRLAQKKSGISLEKV